MHIGFDYLTCIITLTSFLCKGLVWQTETGMQIKIQWTNVTRQLEHLVNDSTVNWEGMLEILTG